VIPKPAKNSTEVTEFKPMNTEEVLDAMQRGEFRPGSELLWINFFIRHEIIPPLILYYNFKNKQTWPKLFTSSLFQDLNDIFIKPSASVL